MERSIIFSLVRIPHMYRIPTNFLQINDLINNIFETCAVGTITVETLCDKSILNLDQQCKSLSRIQGFKSLDLLKLS